MQVFASPTEKRNRHTNTTPTHVIVCASYHHCKQAIGFSCNSTMRSICLSRALSFDATRLTARTSYRLVLVRNRRDLQGVPAVAPYVVDVEPDDGFEGAANIPTEPGMQPEPAVQVAPIASPARHTRCGRLVRPPLRFDQLPD